LTFAHDLSSFTHRMVIDQFKSIGIKKGMRFKRVPALRRRRPAAGIPTRKRMTHLVRDHQSRKT